MFLPNYSSSNIKIKQHLACFSLFGVFWSDLAFFYKWFGIFCSPGHGNPDAFRAAMNVMFRKILEL